MSSASHPTTPMHTSMGRRKHCRKPVAVSPTYATRSTTRCIQLGTHNRYNSADPRQRTRPAADGSHYARLRFDFRPPSDRIDHNHAQLMAEYQPRACGAEPVRADHSGIVIFERQCIAASQSRRWRNGGGDTTLGVRDDVALAVTRAREFRCEILPKILPP